MYLEIMLHKMRSLKLKVVKFDTQSNTLLARGKESVFDP